MSKQYLTQHSIDQASPSDIFSLAVTPAQILCASGDTAIKVYSTTEKDYPIAQSIRNAHKLGAHHVVSNQTGTRAVSVGFGGEMKTWNFKDAQWGEGGEISSTKTVDHWAPAISPDGDLVAATTHVGVIHVWNILGAPEHVHSMETQGSFGLCLAISANGHFVASGHENGKAYVFSLATGKLLHSLAGLTKAIRYVAFSPGGKLLAVAGDARIIALYDVISGEQVAILTGHDAWITSLDWSFTGEYLLSGALDGKVKVWSIDLGSCVCTHSEMEKALWSVKWLPKTGRTEYFVTAGSNKSIAIYREATGG